MVQNGIRATSIKRTLYFSFPRYTIYTAASYSCLLWNHVPSRPLYVIHEKLLAIYNCSAWSGTTCTTQAVEEENVDHTEPQLQKTKKQKAWWCCAHTSYDVTPTSEVDFSLLLFLVCFFRSRVSTCPPVSWPTSSSHCCSVEWYMSWATPWQHWGAASTQFILYSVTMATRLHEEQR